MSRTQIVPFLLLLCVCAVAAGQKKNVLFLLADDLGWNDVQFHGSPQIPTPNIDAICKRGTELTQYYGQPVCSPTRSTIMSGRHVINSGVYFPFAQGGALRLNLSYTLMPEYFLKGGYNTHMVGKWHLGQNTFSSLPTGRGFQTYFGYWSGAEDYYTHSTKGGYDYQSGTMTAFEYNGTYSLYTFVEKATDIIKSYSPGDKPFFMYVALQNVHWPLEVPQKYLDRFPNVPLDTRRHVVAMGSALDDAVGNITSALAQAGLESNTIVVFSSDNGGPTNGNEGTASNNFPLRGGKNTIYEGGTRLAGCVAGPGVPVQRWGGLMHTTDWLPTLVEGAGLDAPVIDGLANGMSVWRGLSGSTTSSRDFILYEAHQSTSDQHGNALRVGDMKIIWTGSTNPQNEQGWHPPSGQDPSKVSYTVKCGPPPAVPSDCSKMWCLFNVTADPCEYHDLAAQQPDVVQSLVARLQPFRSAAVPAVQDEGCTPTINSFGAWRPCGE